MFGIIIVRYRLSPIECSQSPFYDESLAKGLKDEENKEEIKFQTIKSV